MTHPKQPLTPENLEELAALYALDALEADERAQVDAAMAASEAMVQQVRDYECTVTQLPYNVTAPPMAADLKDRLFQRIAGEAVDPHQGSPLLKLLDQSITALKRQSLELSWSAIAQSYAAEIAIWETDEARREVAFFVRAKTGGPFPNHAHAAGETVLVLEGDFVVEGQSFGVGERIYAHGNTSHQPETHNGCLLLCVSSMDDEILG